MNSLTLLPHSLLSPLRFLLFCGLLMSSTYAFAQNWVDEGYTPSSAIAYDQDGNTQWTLTRNNIYKSTDGGNSWNQNIDANTAPFYSEDELSNQSGSSYPFFDAGKSRVFGDFMFLGLRTQYSEFEYWTTPDAGLSFNAFEFDADYYNETYDLGNNRYMIQVSDYDNTQVSSHICKWYYSSDGGVSFNQVITQYGRYSSIVGTTNNSFIIHDEDKIYYHNFSNIALNKIVDLPEVSQFVSVDENKIRAISYDIENSNSATSMTMYSSFNGGVSFQSQTTSRSTGAIFDFALIDDNLYYDYTKYDLNNFTNGPIDIRNINSDLSGPFKKTLDGNLASRIVNGFNVPSFNTPIFISTDNLNSVTPVRKVQYSLEAMAQFGSTYGRFVGNTAYSTNDGYEFEQVADFFGSALKEDIVYLDNAMYTSTYSDPSSTAYFSNDGVNFKRTNEIGLAGSENGTSITYAGNGEYFQSGNNLIARMDSFEDNIYLSSDNGNNWSLLPGAYNFSRNIFTDQKNGVMYSYTSETFQGNGFPIKTVLYKSLDNGLTWTILETNIPEFTYFSFVGYQGRPFMAYNNHLFAKIEGALYKSSNGGASFEPIAFPGEFAASCVWIDNGKIHVNTQDEKIYTLDIDQWLGANPASTQDGYQVDLELSITLDPPNPGPYSDFDVVVTLKNNSARTANNISIERPFLNNPVAVNRGDEQPTYSPNFAWASGGNNSLAPGEVATASYPYYRLDGGEIKTNAYIRSQKQPDVDSRPGSIKDENNPEDDEAIYPAPSENGSIISVNCPDNVFKQEGSPTGPVGGGFTGFGDVILPAPTATTTCPGGIVSIEHVGTAPTFNFGGNLWLDGPGEYAIFWEITDACGKTETCLYSAEVVIPAFQFEFTTCPQDIILTAPAGANGMVVDYGPLGFQSNCPFLVSDSGITEGLQSGSFFPLGTTKVSHFASNQQCGTAVCSFNVMVLSPNQGTAVDLELAMEQSVENPLAYSTFKRTVTITNTGTNISNSIQVSIPLYEGMVFSGGEEYTASQGFYSSYGDQIWTVGGLGSGQSASIELTYFPLQNITAPGYAQVINSSGNDIDSTPNNGTPPSVNEDDEASTSGGVVEGNGLVLNCPGDFEIELEYLETTGPVDYSYTATTDCPTGEVSISIIGAGPGQIGIFGSYPITITATDECGRTETCSFNVTLKTAPVNPTQVICPNDITVTAASANGAIVNWEEPSVISDCSPFLSYTFPESGSLLPVGTTEVTFVYAESGPLALCGNSGVQCTFNVTVLSPNEEENSGVDLELAMTQSTEAPNAFEAFSRVVTVTNKGTLPAMNIEIEIPTYDGMVFSGGNEYTASEGSFDFYNPKKVWRNINLAAGESANITVRYFSLQNITEPGYAQVIAMDGQDIDSSPNNGTPPAVNEDDEASTSGGIIIADRADLTISNFNIASQIVVGQLTDYTFDLNNIGAIAALTDYKIELFLSTDNSLSANDIFIGEVNTGNTFPGTIAGVNAQAIANNVNPGSYRLIVFVDSNNNIQESNENNNITTYPIQVVNGTQTGADVSLSAGFNSIDQFQYEVYSITYIVENEGTESTNDVQVDVLLVPGAVYSGGNEYETTKGTFGVYFDHVWRVGTLNPGEAEELTINYYKLSSSQNQHYAQVISSSANDTDSAPNNGTYGLTREDDEVFIRTNDIQIRRSNPSTIKFEVLDVSPNPSSGEEVYLTINTPSTQEKDIYIYDLLGRLIVTQKEILSEGENKIKLETQSLSAGMFLVVLQDQDLKMITKKFVIEK